MNPAFRPPLLIAALALVMGSWGSRGHAQSKPTPADLLPKLESEATADQAAEQLRKLAQSDPAGRRFLVLHLPPMIEEGPKIHAQAWRSAVQLAGDLRMVEAAPALAKWLGLDSGSEISDMHREAKLEHSAPGKALFQIGDPAVPYVQAALAHGTSRERWTAAYVLNRIGSEKARAAMRDSLPEQTDETLRWFINRSLSK